MSTEREVKFMYIIRISNPNELSKAQLRIANCVGEYNKFISYVSRRLMSLIEHKSALIGNFKVHINKSRFKCIFKYIEPCLSWLVRMRIIFYGIPIDYCY